MDMKYCHWFWWNFIISRKKKAYPKPWTVNQIFHHASKINEFQYQCSRAFVDLLRFGNGSFEFPLQVMHHLLTVLELNHDVSVILFAGIPLFLCLIHLLIIFSIVYMPKWYLRFPKIHLFSDLMKHFRLF